MSDRSDRVRLPATTSRCEPQRPCKMRSRCARVQAPILQGSIVEDFTVGDFVRDQRGGTATCPGFMNVADVHQDTPPPRQVKPAVKGLA
mgnify:CR=1 FL=1